MLRRCMSRCVRSQAVWTRPFSTPSLYDHRPGPIAFAFDIDGVLIREKTVLPAATECVGW